METKLQTASIMTIKPILIMLISGAALSGTALNAQIFEFGPLNNGGQAASDLDGKSSASTTAGGITLTATANSGTFNSSNTAGFGINGAGDDTGTTEFDQDSSNNADVMTFSFDNDVTFKSIGLTNFGVSDRAFLTIGSNTVTIDSGTFVFEPGLTLSANTAAIFGFQAGNGFELASLSIIPEPKTCALFAGFLGLSSLMVRRRMSA